MNRQNSELGTVTAFSFPKDLAMERSPATLEKKEDISWVLVICLSLCLTPSQVFSHLLSI